MRETAIELMCLFVLVAGGSAFGMATEQIGPDRADRPTMAQPGWPKGIVELARHESRVYSIWVNGNESFYFKATPEDVNELVTLFSQTRMRDHEVMVASEPKPVKTFKGESINYNVSLQVVAGIALFMAREGRAGTELPLEPRLTIHVGDDALLLQKVTWPENLILTNEVPDLSLPSGRTRPKREVYYGRLAFADGSPTQEFVMGVNSRITLWEQGEPNGIEVGHVNNQGYFSVLLSDQELADLRVGKTWLTATISNYLTEARQTDARIPPDKLVRDKEQAQPVEVQGPPYYYGRILFEDGAPPVLDPAPWPGAEIHLDFSYAGMARLDAEGYFKVMLTEAQIEKLSADKPRRNIYVPDMLQTGRSSATMTYPPSLLSQDKAQAGVVKIPRPELPKKDLPTAESRIGKPIPGFDNIRFEGFQPEQGEGKPLLVCFWDMDQRSSRQCIQTLERQKGTLQTKGLVVLAIHSGTQSRERLGQWLQDNEMTLPVGAIEADIHETLLAWGAKGAPWLILTDERHIVIEEGFNLDAFLAGEQSIRQESGK